MLEQPTDADRGQASDKSLEKMWKFVTKFAEKSGTYLHPQREITEFLVIGLAKHVDDLGRPLCPCNFYGGQARGSEALDVDLRLRGDAEVQVLPLTALLQFGRSSDHRAPPPDHEGREIYGLIEDPHPDKGRALGRLEEKQGRTIKK